MNESQEKAVNQLRIALIESARLVSLEACSVVSSVCGLSTKQRKI